MVTLLQYAWNIPQTEEPGGCGPQGLTESAVTEHTRAREGRSVLCISHGHSTGFECKGILHSQLRKMLALCPVLYTVSLEWTGL